MSRFQRIGVPLESAPVPFAQMVRETIRSLADLVGNLATIFDKGVGITDNLDVDIIDVVTNATPDTAESFTHSLGRVPVGYIVMQLNKAGILYDGGPANTKTAIYFKCNVASVTAKVMVF
jgi:hypothetical protein